MAPKDEPCGKLAAAGFRVTRTRLIIARQLWNGPGGRHVDAAVLHNAIRASGEKVSLATICNALREFEQAGLIRRVAVPSERVWYDTDTDAHRHFYIEAENRVLDMPDDGRMEPPEGFRVSRIDTVAHLERVAGDE